MVVRYFKHYSSERLFQKSGIKLEDRFYSRLTVQRQDTEEGITRITTTLSVTDNQPLGQSADRNVCRNRKG